MMTVYDVEISDRMASKYLKTLVNRFYKILPLKEDEEDSLQPYLDSLLREMLGLHDLISLLKDDDRYLTLLSMVQYFISHETSVSEVRTEVFRAISILKKLQEKYCVNER